MATLKHVQESQNGTFEAPIQQEPTFNNLSIEPEVKSNEPYNVIFRLVKKKKGRVRLDSICNNVLNPKTGKRERIWLLMGAPSIWQSDLTELLKDKDYVNKSRYSLTFEDSICRVSSIHENELEFARANTNNVGKRRNGSGKYDYYEYDANEEQKAKLEAQMLQINLVLKIKDMPEQDMKKLALFLDIKPYDEIGQLKSHEGMRTELMLKANLQPTLVSKYIDSKEVEVSYLVRKAIVEAKIDLTGQSGNALWAGGKGFIAKIPSHKKPLEYLTELAMTNSNEGRTFKEQLEQIVT